MITVNLFDNNFIHTKDLIGTITSTYLYPPNDIRWLDKLPEYDGITIFTDHYILDDVVDKVKSNLKIAWLLEPPVLSSGIYNSISTIEHKFDYILTFDSELLQRGPKYIKYIMGQSRITDDITALYEKNKKVSIISSGKSMSHGHRFRGKIVNALHSKHNFDLWGYAFRSFQEKTEPLKDYEFSISVQNCKIDNYFTEILLDCFRLGTIPIFWGCPNIGDYFDIRGMELFDTIEELDDILSNLKPYEEYLEYAKTNFMECKRYIHTDDYIANILKTL